MFGNIKKLFRWGPSKASEDTDLKSQLLKALAKTVEDILLWKNMWLSLGVILFINVLFLICLYKNINILQLFIAIATVLVSIDAFETWLKYKHRTAFLKSLVPYENVKLYQTAVKCNIWMKKRLSEFVILRETNHAKAFLLTNIAFGTIYFIGRSISGFSLVYIIVMAISVSHLLLPYVARALKKIQQHAESDSEIESLMPVASEQDMKELTFELDNADTGKRSIDYWKLEEIPGGEISDSSENSSLDTNINIKNVMQSLDRDMYNTSDSSDDDFIPRAQHEQQMQSTLEIIQPESWSNSAYSAFRNLSGVVAGMVYTQPTRAPPLGDRVSSADSSDGFELIDKNDLT